MIDSLSKRTVVLFCKSINAIKVHFELTPCHPQDRVLYVRLSVGRSVGQSVGRTIRPSIGPGLVLVLEVLGGRAVVHAACVRVHACLRDFRLMSVDRIIIREFVRWLNLLQLLLSLLLLLSLSVSAVASAPALTHEERANSQLRPGLKPTSREERPLVRSRKRAGNDTTRCSLQVIHTPNSVDSKLILCVSTPPHTPSLTNASVHLRTLNQGEKLPLILLGVLLFHCIARSPWSSSCYCSNT